jgi:hypothetical protein
MWKDAEPDIPVLKQANAEYAKLQRSLRNYLFLRCADTSPIVPPGPR